MKHTQLTIRDWENSWTQANILGKHNPDFYLDMFLSNIERILFWLNVEYKPQTLKQLLK